MDRLNQWLTLAANVGVLAGIFFLAFEIQQNTEQLKSGALSDMATRLDTRTILMATDSGLADRWLRGYTDPESLTTLDQIHLTWWVAAWVADLEEAYRQYQLGTIPEAALNSRLTNVKDIISTPIGGEAWAELSSQTDPEFSRWANRAMNLAQTGSGK